ncbi:gp53-like domain-containing protein [Microvirga lotononidis]|uniref:Putative tail fiber protein gp53-like C-terminal domain-containing protein n=1 Tax=Microvirga lotononidis TaxID=864069 RepID=I4YP69_9HYPH|nr:hypothetical protein [Microvirga lotononidis]EIM25761.1 hypothetical protein MicloDRAFT_00064880 [Microvirga lotononidis]WQO25688.1 hypothetical protein U0023_13270 [Microvirga lotononidis]
MPVTSWSTTASANATADSASGIIFSEGQAPSSLNDSMRALMAVIKGDFANSLAGTGYQKLPNGLILQWGTTVGTTNANGNFVITFPIAFPTAVRTVIPVNGDQEVITLGAQSIGVINSVTTTTSFAVSVRPNPGSGAGFRINWLAIGQ